MAMFMAWWPLSYYQQSKAQPIVWGFVSSRYIAANVCTKTCTKPKSSSKMGTPISRPSQAEQSECHNEKLQHFSDEMMREVTNLPIHHTQWQKRIQAPDVWKLLLWLLSVTEAKSNLIIFQRSSLFVYDYKRLFEFLTLRCSVTWHSCWWRELSSTSNKTLYYTI